jgi:uncharacterized protein
MQLHEIDDPRVFQDRAFAFLMHAEAERCVELGIINRLIDGFPGSTTGRVLAQLRLWIVEDGGQVQAVVVQNVSDRLIVSRAPETAIDLIAQRLHELNWEGHSINGVFPTSGMLAARFSRLTGRPTHRAIRLKLMELRQVFTPVPVPGQLRQCVEADYDLVKKWTVEFCNDVGEPCDDGGQIASTVIEERRVFFWDHSGGISEPRAMAAWQGPTPNGVRISWVYTPPEYRRRGYASNLVAQLSQKLLNEGRKFCFLHTDQANPTSNHVYESIGYRPVCECERWDIQTQVQC